MKTVIGPQIKTSNKNVFLMEVNGYYGANEGFYWKEWFENSENELKIMIRYFQMFQIIKKGETRTRNELICKMRELGLNDVNLRVPVDSTLKYLPNTLDLEVLYYNQEGIAHSVSFEE